MSVIVPAYKPERLMLGVLQSILELREFLELEVICVFNGEPGSLSPREAEEFMEDAANVKFQIIEVELADAPNARNIGAKCSGNELLKFVDCDDVIIAHEVHAQVVAMGNCHVSTSDHFVDDNLTPSSLSRRQYGSVLDGLISGRIGITSGAIFHRQSIQNIEWKVGQTCNQEKQFLLECFRRGLRFHQFKGPTFVKHCVGDSISSRVKVTGQNILEVARFRIEIYHEFKATMTLAEIEVAQVALHQSLRSLEWVWSFESCKLISRIIFSAGWQWGRFTKAQKVVLFASGPLGYFLMFGLKRRFSHARKD